MNILVVDDHPLVRRGIIDILSINKNMHEILEADDIENTFRILKCHSINVIIVDLHLGKESGFDLLEQVRMTYQEIKSIILTSSCKYLDFKRAQQIDVDGYILKDAFVEDILYALNVVCRGDKYYSPQLLSYSSYKYETMGLNTLTEREREVLLELSKGMTNSQISKILYISEGTTKKHISNILDKLNLNNRVEAVIYAGKLWGQHGELIY